MSGLERGQKFMQALYGKGVFPKLTVYLRTLLLVFGISFSLLLIMFCILFFADTKGWIDSQENAQTVTFAAIVVGGMLLSLLMTVAIHRLVLVPMRHILDAIKLVGQGNFDVRIETDDRSELGILSASLNQMIESLGNLDKMRNDFVANVSHEFKTPLASIQGCAALLQDENLTPDERRQYARLVHSSAKRLSTLSTNILELSKLENGAVKVQPSCFMLDEHLRQALLVLQDEWQKKDIELNLELPEVKYCGSDELLMQVWLNLLGNAIKFSPQGGRVDVLLEKLPSAAVVTVTDQGVGISEAEQRLIFEKFYQADTSHKTEGNGLGLAMVRRIISLLRADIEVVSRPGEGASFIVTLPLDEPAK